MDWRRQRVFRNLGRRLGDSPENNLTIAQLIAQQNPLAEWLFNETTGTRARNDLSQYSPASPGPDMLGGQGSPVAIGDWTLDAAITVSSGRLNFDDSVNSSAIFGPDINIRAGDTVRVTYSITTAGAGTCQFSYQNSSGTVIATLTQAVGGAGTFDFTVEVISPADATTNSRIRFFAASSAAFGVSLTIQNIGVMGGTYVGSPTLAAYTLLGRNAVALNGTSQHIQLNHHPQQLDAIFDETIGSLLFHFLSPDWSAISGTDYILQIGADANNNVRLTALANVLRFGMSAAGSSVVATDVAVGDEYDNKWIPVVLEWNKAGNTITIRTPFGTQAATGIGALTWAGALTANFCQVGANAGAARFAGGVAQLYPFAALLGQNWYDVYLRTAQAEDSNIAGAA